MLPRYTARDSKYQTVLRGKGGADPTQSSKSAREMPSLVSRFAPLLYSCKGDATICHRHIVYML